MSQQPRYFRIGLFIVIALAILVAGAHRFRCGSVLSSANIYRDVCECIGSRGGYRIAGEVQGCADRAGERD